MATAKICDRCGNVYGKNTVQESFNEESWGTMRGVCVMFDETDKFRKGEIVIAGAPVRKNHYMDLCDNCTKQISLFLRNKDAKIISEPYVVPR